MGYSGIYRIGEKSVQHGPARALGETERVHSVCPRVEHTNFVHFAIYTEDFALNPNQFLTHQRYIKIIKNLASLKK